jgi:hypothetical protein
MTEVSFKEVQAASEEPDVTLVQAKESEMAGITVQMYLAQPFS